MEKKIKCPKCGSYGFDVVSSQTDARDDAFLGPQGVGRVDEPKLKCSRCGFEYKPSAMDYLKAFFK